VVVGGGSSCSRAEQKRSQSGPEETGEKAINMSKMKFEMAAGDGRRTGRSCSVDVSIERLI
jgi:hypothetical protein